MVRIKEVVIEAGSPSKLVRFWSEALTDVEAREYDDEEIARMASTRAYAALSFEGILGSHDCDR